MFFEKTSVSISLYYFYLKFKSVFFLKSRKIWGRWSTKYIRLSFMPYFHCLLSVSCLHATGFFGIPLEWVCYKGRVAMPAACKTCLNIFAIIISANQQQLPEDHKWKQENGDFSQCGRYLQNKLSKISDWGESVLPKAKGILQTHFTAASAVSTVRPWGW